MSLHRVSSMESWERLRGSSPAASEHRKMSFNPVTDWVSPTSTQRQPVSAMEVSKFKRSLQVIIACVYCLLAAGIVFGYAAFKPILVKEGVYRGYCTEGNRGDEKKTCYQQEIRLNLMFTIAAVSTNVVALPVGIVLDRYGPRLCGIIGSVFLALGSMFLIIATQIPFDGYIPGYLFLALGGPFIFISSFQLSNCFPRHSGLILALLTGAFDSSSAIFLVYRLIYFSPGGGLSPRRFFMVYLVVPVFTLIMQILIMPANSYKTVGEIVKQAEDSSNDVLPNDGNLDNRTREDIIREQRRARRDSVLSEMTPLIGGKKGHDKAKKQEERKKEISGVWGALHGRSALQQIKTPWFILITLFVVIQMTRINYFVATIRPQYEYLLSKYKLAVHVNNIFDVALPVGGIISIPFIGMILDNLSTTATLALLVVWASLIGIFGVLPYLWAAYANVALFVIYRPLYYTAVSDYAAKVFGFHTFGKVYGLIICISGLFNFSQSGLDALTHRVFDSDPVPVNLILLSAVFAVGVVLVGYIYRKSLIMARDYLEEEAEEAIEAVMPDVSGGQEDGFGTMNRDSGRNGTA